MEYAVKWTYLLHLEQNELVPEVLRAGYEARTGHDPMVDARVVALQTHIHEKIVLPCGLISLTCLVVSTAAILVGFIESFFHPVTLNTVYAVGCEAAFFLSCGIAAFLIAWWHMLHGGKVDMQARKRVSQFADDLWHLAFWSQSTCEEMRSLSLFGFQALMNESTRPNRRALLEFVKFERQQDLLDPLRIPLNPTLCAAFVSLQRQRRTFNRLGLT